MTTASDILLPECTIAGLDAQSKKRALELASERLAEVYPGVRARVLFDALLTRERLGSTALGDGVAIPHCRVDCEQIMGAFMTLTSAIDFDAPDDAPVDLMFVLVVPTGETDQHLSVLATLASVFGDEEKRQSLKSADSSESLYARMSAYLAGS